MKRARLVTLSINKSCTKRIQPSACCMERLRCPEKKCHVEREDCHDTRAANIVIAQLDGLLHMIFLGMHQYTLPDTAPLPPPARTRPDTLSQSPPPNRNPCGNNKKIHSTIKATVIMNRPRPYHYFLSKAKARSSAASIISRSPGPLSLMPHR